MPGATEYTNYDYQNIATREGLFLADGTTPKYHMANRYLTGPERDRIRQFGENIRMGTFTAEENEQLIMNVQVLSTRSTRQQMLDYMQRPFHRMVDGQPAIQLLARNVNSRSGVQVANRIKRMLPILQPHLPAANAAPAAAIPTAPPAAPLAQHEPLVQPHGAAQQQHQQAQQLPPPLVPLPQPLIPQQVHQQQPVPPAGPLHLHPQAQARTPPQQAPAPRRAPTPMAPRQHQFVPFAQTQAESIQPHAPAQQHQPPAQPAMPGGGLSPPMHMQDDMQQLFNALPEFSFSGAPNTSSAQNECTVCLELYDAGDKVQYLPCWHLFHSGCIGEWLRQKRMCPVCNADVMDSLRESQQFMD